MYYCHYRLQYIMKYGFVKSFPSMGAITLCESSSYTLPNLSVQSRTPNFRNYSTKNDLNDIRTVARFKELEIPVLNGKISAKAWGSETAYPVLALHGWLDNCGTFDKLIPLLSDKFYFVAIDMPGHGRSLHKPPGCLYTDISMVIDFKKVIDYFDWKKCHIMGHSLGGQLAMLFSSIFPDNVKKLIMLDIVKPFSTVVDVVTTVKIKGIEDYINCEKKLCNSPPVYNSETAVSRLIHGMHNEITVESAEILLKRGVKMSDCGKGLIFSRDLRCRPIEIISCRDHATTEQFALAMKCELLIILSNNTHSYYKPETSETIDTFLDLYRNNLKKFVLEYVEGNHFVHLNSPETIAPIINKYLLNEN